MSRFIDNSMSIKSLAFIVPTPKVSVHFGSFNNIVPDELCAWDFVPVSHDECPHIFGTSLIEAKDPHVALDSALSVVSELGLIYLNSSSEMAKLMIPIVVLEVQMDQVARFTIDVIHILVLESGNVELFKVSESL